MLRSAKALIGYRMLSSDNAEVGKVRDFYFDDMIWIVRYLVDDTGGWLRGRRVLLSPAVLEEPDWESELFPVLLSEEQIMDSPGVDMDKPVSRQMEEELSSHFNWPSYWSEIPMPIPVPGMGTGELPPEEECGDPNLRSIKEVSGYSIESMDGDVGQVDDFILDDDWTIRYIVIDTRRWLPGRKVLVSPSWIESVEWLESKVRIDMMSESIKAAPEFDPTAPVNREYETRLYDFYGRPVYWPK